ncbi:hypothetical protein [Phaeobacter sp. NW0010-22]|uniref:hypothetical protein n=1 Tax=Phaeobacter sp. NW0010-22 TaxID=3135907 RepID=UPI003107B51F
MIDWEKKLDWVKNQANTIKSGVKSKQPMKVGQALTKVFLLVVLILAIGPQYTNEDGWELRIVSFALSPANEIGDTFAGIAGVLAFLWIIVTVWLQSKELAAQHKELKATREELKLTREAHQKQVSILEKQAVIFEIEQADRLEMRAKDQFDQMLGLLSELMQNEERWGSRWRPRNLNSSGMIIGLPVFEIRKATSADDAVKQGVSGSLVCLRGLKEYFHKKTDISKSDIRDAYLQCLSFVHEVMRPYEQLSPGQKMRFDSMGLDQLRDNLRELLEMDIWVESGEV